MTPAELLAQLRQDFPAGAGTGEFVVDHVADGAYDALLAAAGVPASVALTSAAGWTATDTTVSLTGTATGGLLGITPAPVTFAFVQAGTGFVLTLRVTLPASWRFGDSFALLRDSVFDDFALDPAAPAYLTVTSDPAAEGMSFSGTFARSSTFLTQIAWLLTGTTVGAVSGPVGYDAATGAVDLVLPLVSVPVSGLFGEGGPTVTLGLDLFSGLDGAGRQYVRGVRFGTSLGFGTTTDATQSVHLTALWTSAEQGILELAVSGTALAFPTPETLARYFGPDNGIASSLPDQFAGGNLVQVDGLVLGLGLGSHVVEYAALSVGALTGQTWKIWPDVLELGDITFLFSVFAPATAPVYSFTFSAVLVLGGVPIRVQAVLTRGAATSTVLSGALAAGPEPLRPLLRHVFGRDVDVPDDLAITALDFSADITQQVYAANLEVEGEWSFEFGTANDVTFRGLGVGFEYDATAGAAGELTGAFDVGSNEFAVELDLTAEGVVFTGTWENAEDPLTFVDIAIALGMYGLADLPEGVDLALVGATFTFDTGAPSFVFSIETASHGGAALVAGKDEAGTGWGFVYGMVVGLDLSLDLTDIDVVGRLVPSGMDVLALKNLRIVAATETLPVYDSTPRLEELIGPEVNSGLVLSVELLVGTALDKTFAVRFGGADDGTSSDTPPALPGVVEAAVVPVQSGATSAAKAAPAPQGKWIDVQRAFGPVQIDRVGAMVTDDGKLALLLDAAVSLGGLRIGLTGLRAAVPTSAPFTPTFDLAGLAISFTGGGVRIGGSLVRTPGTAGVAASYGGTLTVVVGTFGLTALGAYTTVDGQPSLFAFVYVDAPLGGPPAFFVTGLAGGFGYNRTLTLPGIDGVADFPLVKGATGALDADQTRRALEGVVKPEVNQQWLAAGVRFTSFEMVKAFALLTVAFGAQTEIALMGVATVSVPPGATEPVARAEMVLLVHVAPASGVVSVEARLTPASYVLDRKAQLTGGFAFYTWFGPSPFRGDFVVTLGGYNPYFTPPKHYPQVPRLGLNWQVSRELTIKGGLYFAVTPAALMAGGFLQATWRSGGISAWFDAQADFLIRFKPFHYEIAVRVSIGASFEIDLWFTTVTMTIHVGVDLRLWGPPFGGEARIDLSIISFTIAFGSKPQTALPPIKWSEFRDTFLPPSRGAAALTGADGVVETDSVLTVSVSHGLIGTMTDAGTELSVVDPGGTTLVVGTQVPSTTAHVVAQSTFVPSGEWNTGFGVGPMGLAPGPNVVVELTVTVTRDAGRDTWAAAATTGNVPKGLWLNVTNKPDRNGLVEDVLLGTVLTPVPPAPDVLVPIPVAVLAVGDPGVRRFGWSSTAVPTTDPFDQTKAMAELRRTLVDPAVAATRSGVLAELRRQGLSTAAAVDVTRLAADAPDVLFAPPALRYLGEQPATKGTAS